MECGSHPSAIRALILARTRAGGLDIAGQERRRCGSRSGKPIAKAESRQCRDWSPPDPPCSHARRPTCHAHGDVERLSIASTILVAALAALAFPLALGPRRYCGPGRPWYRRGRPGGAARLWLRARRRGRLRHDDAGRQRGLSGFAGRPPQAGRGRASNLATHRPGLHIVRAHSPRWG